MIPPADDIDRLMAVMDTAFDPQFGEAWNRRQVEDALLIGNCHYFLIDEFGEPADQGQDAAGFYLSRSGFGEEELLLFAVSPNHRRKGLGRRILEKLRSDALSRANTRLLLEMRHGNPAESLYRALGFLPIGRRPDYYRSQNGVRIDAITFATDLTD